MIGPARLLHNCVVIDGVSSRPLPEAAVLVRGERIAAVGRESDVASAAADDCQRIDLGGGFLMAGLANMHTHFSLSLPGERGEQVKRLTAHGLALHMAHGARETLLAGVTTVRCVGEKDHAEFALREAIGNAAAHGPRIFTAGRGLVCTGGHGHDSGSTVEADGPDEFRKVARAQIKAGADLIKVMISGGIAGEHERIGTPQLTEDEMAAVIDVAHDWGRKVTAHAGPAGAIRTAVEHGLDCVEHGYQLTPEVADLMARRGTALVPTLVVTRCGSFFDQLGVPQWMQRRSLDAGPQHLESFRTALAAGVTPMLGSDMPPPESFDGTTATVRELEHMAGAGMSPTDALRAATRTPAEWLDAADDLGTVQAGKYADLIAMDADPTADVSALRGIRWVMKGGRVVRDDRGPVRLTG